MPIFVSRTRSRPWPHSSRRPSKIRSHRREGLKHLGVLENRPRKQHEVYPLSTCGPLYKSIFWNLGRSFFLLPIKALRSFSQEVPEEVQKASLWGLRDLAMSLLSDGVYGTCEDTDYIDIDWSSQSRPPVPFWGWEGHPIVDYFIGFLGCSLGYRGFDPWPCSHATHVCVVFISFIYSCLWKVSLARARNDHTCTDMHIKILT